MVRYASNNTELTRDVPCVLRRGWLRIAGSQLPYNHKPVNQSFRIDQNTRDDSAYSAERVELAFVYGSKDKIFLPKYIVQGHIGPSCDGRHAEIAGCIVSHFHKSLIGTEGPSNFDKVSRIEVPATVELLVDEKSEAHEKRDQRQEYTYPVLNSNACCTALSSKNRMIICTLLERKEPDKCPNNENAQSIQDQHPV